MLVRSRQNVPQSALLRRRQLAGVTQRRRHRRCNDITTGRHVLRVKHATDGRRRSGIAVGVLAINGSPVRLAVGARPPRNNSRQVVHVTAM